MKREEALVFGMGVAFYGDRGANAMKNRSTGIAVIGTLVGGLLVGCGQDPLVGTWATSDGVTLVLSADHSASMTAAFHNVPSAGCVETDRATGATWSSSTMNGSRTLVVEAASAMATEERSGCANSADDQLPQPIPVNVVVADGSMMGRVTLSDDQNSLVVVWGSGINISAQSYTRQ